MPCTVWSRPGKWRPYVDWMGWRRMLWLAVQVDCNSFSPGLSVVLFGLHLSVRRKPVITSMPNCPCFDRAD